MAKLTRGKLPLEIEPEDARHPRFGKAGRISVEQERPGAARPVRPEK